MMMTQARPRLAEKGVTAAPPAGENHAFRARRGAIWRALWWREVCETGPLVLLLWGVGALLLAFIFGMILEGFRRRIIHSTFIMDSTILGFLPTACAVVGMVLGVAIHRTTRAFDAWAFLVHRPITRGALWGYRMRIGLRLYAITVGAPLLVFLVWTSVDQRARPEEFRWAFYLPYVADVMLGAAAFFAGSLVVQRQARMFASGILPVLLLVGLFICDVAMGRFVWVAAILVSAIVLLGVAGWSSAQTHGAHWREPRWARFALILVLFAGAMAPASAVTGLVTVWEHARMQEASSQARSPVTRWLWPVLLEDGSVAVRLGESKGEQSTARLARVTGEPVAGDMQELTYGMAVTFETQGTIGQLGRYSYRDVQSVLLGPPEHKTADDFGIEVPRGESFVAAKSATMEKVPYRVIATDAHFYLYEGLERTPRVALRLPNWARLDGLTLRVTPDLSTYVLMQFLGGVYEFGTEDSALQGRELRFAIFNREGRPVTTHSIVLEKLPFPAYVEDFDPYGRIEAMTWVANAVGTLGLPAPVRWRLGVLRRHFWGTVLPVHVLTALGVLLLARRRVLGRRKTIGWALAALIAGPWTFVALFGTEHALPRLRCPACGRMRRADQEHCPWCSAEMPMHETTAREIFSRPVPDVVA